MLVRHVADGAARGVIQSSKPPEAKVSAVMRKREPDSASLRSSRAANLTETAKPTRIVKQRARQRSGPAGWLGTAGTDRSVRNLGGPFR